MGAGDTFLRIQNFYNTASRNPVSRKIWAITAETKNWNMQDAKILLTFFDKG